MLDISDELQICRYGHGVQLMSPGKMPSSINQRLFVKDVLSLPCSVYFENTQGVIQRLNQRNVELLGFDSAKQAMGKPYYSNFSTKASESILFNDKMVMRNKTLQIYEEEVIHVDEIIYSLLSIKMPFFGRNNELIGLFGFSAILGIDSLAASLKLISKMGFLNSEIPLAHNSIQTERILSKQQYQCASFMLSGMTYKEIGKRLQLSHRTIESYIDNMKAKLKCKNKSELISKLTEMLKLQKTID